MMSRLQVRVTDSEIVIVTMQPWDHTGDPQLHCCAQVENSYLDEIVMCAREQQPAKWGQHSTD